LFKGDKHLDETHRSGQRMGEQQYAFAEVGDYTSRIENINGDGENEMIELSLHVTPEFPSVLILASMAMLFAASIALPKSKRLW
jgi:hypothetical protein